MFLCLARHALSEDRLHPGSGRRLESDGGPSKRLIQPRVLEYAVRGMSGLDLYGDGKRSAAVGGDPYLMVATALAYQVAAVFAEDSTDGFAVVIHAAGLRTRVLA